MLLDESMVVFIMSSKSRDITHWTVITVRIIISIACCYTFANRKQWEALNAPPAHSSSVTSVAYHGRMIYVACVKKG